MRLGGLGSTHLLELLAQRLCWGNLFSNLKKTKQGKYEQISRNLHVQTEKKNNTIDKVHSYDRVRGGKQEEMKEV